MINLRINPVGFATEHVAALNRSFGDWGDERRWQWCFARPTSSIPADIIVAELNGKVIAGTGVTYRWLMMPNGKTCLAGILTAAWSFPVKSALGSYMLVMGEAMRRTAERGGALALGFMPQTKSSGHQLLRGGAMATATGYVSKPPGWRTNDKSTLRPCVLTSDLVEELFRRVNIRASGVPRLVYSDVGDFAGQFLERPRPVEVFLDAGDCYFIFERLPKAANLLAILPASGSARPLRHHFAEAAQFATSLDCDLLAYASNGVAIAAATAAGLTTKPGFITISIVDHKALSLVTTGIEDAATACFAMLQHAHVENGDRM